ncbi:hypothetical protein IFR05_009161 [Cadophora sp. M221]|nr:hypothetical protein IFR05_009161 [Cadophora sp. M221]
MSSINKGKGKAIDYSDDDDPIKSRYRHQGESSDWITKTLMKERELQDHTKTALRALHDLRAGLEEMQRIYSGSLEKPPLVIHFLSWILSRTTNASTLTIQTPTHQPRS